MEPEHLEEKPKLGPPIDILEVALIGPARFRYWLVPCALVGLCIGVVMAMLRPSFYSSTANVWIEWGEREVWDADKLIKGAGGGPGGFGMMQELMFLRNSTFYEKIAREVGPGRLLERIDYTRHDTPSTPRFVRWQHQFQNWWYNGGLERNPEAETAGFDLDSQEGVRKAKILLSRNLRMRSTRGQPHVLTISYGAASPELAQDVVSAATKVTIQRHFEIFDSRFNPLFVTAQRDEAEEELREASEEYYKHQQDCGFFDIELQRRNLLNQKVAVNNSLEAAKLRLEEIDRELEYVEEQLLVVPEKIEEEVEARDMKNPVYFGAEENLQKLAAQLASLSSTYIEGSPVFEQHKTALETQIAAAEEILATNPPYLLREFDYLRPTKNPEFLELERRQEKLEREKENLLIGEMRAQNQLNLIGETMDAIVACEPKHDDMRDVIGKSRARANQFQQALDRRDAVKVMDVDETMGNIWVMSPASYNEAPMGATRSKAVLMGLGGGLGVGLFLGVLRQLLDSKFRYPFGVAKSLGVPVLGVVPEQRAWKRLTRQIKKAAAAA